MLQNQGFKADRSVIESLPLFYQAAFNVLEREGLITVGAGGETRTPANEKGRGGRAAINPHPKTLRQNTATTTMDVCGGV